MKWAFDGSPIPETYEEQLAYQARVNGQSTPRPIVVPVATNASGTVPEVSGLGALSRSAALERIAARSTEWRVKSLISTDDYGTLAGPKGIGKTFALLDLGVSVALGEPWFGRSRRSPRPSWC